MPAPLQESGFWFSQPVPLRHGVVPRVAEPASQRRAEIPTAFATFAPGDQRDLDEVAGLLARGYVADASGSFALGYDATFLRWALAPRGQLPAWHIGARDPDGNLVGFISAVAGRVRLDDAERSMVSVNFLCVDPRWRGQGLASLLIKELTRRVNASGITEALFTTSSWLPVRPVSAAFYFTRLLRPLELSRTGFVQRPRALSEADFLRRHALSRQTVSSGFRPIEEQDLPAVRSLFQRSLAVYRLAPVWSLEELRHCLMPAGAGVARGYVLADSRGRVTAAAGLYDLPYVNTRPDAGAEGSTILSTYLSCIAPLPAALDLLEDLAAVAFRDGFQVLSCLGIMGLAEHLPERKFLPTDGRVSYYLYNYGAGEAAPSLGSHEVAFFPV